MNTENRIIETVDFLESLMAGIEDCLTDRIDAFADYLGIPILWISQLMHSTLCQPSNDFKGGARVACSLMHFMLKEENNLLRLRTYLEEAYGEQIIELFDEAATYMASYCGKMHSYYDLYIAANWPEILGKSDDWVWQDANVPADAGMSMEADSIGLNQDGHATVHDVKRYIRSTVPLSKRNAVFGEAA